MAVIIIALQDILNIRNLTTHLKSVSPWLTGDKLQVAFRLLVIHVHDFRIVGSSGKDGGVLAGTGVGSSV